MRNTDCASCDGTGICNDCENDGDPCTDCGMTGKCPDCPGRDRREEAR